MGGVQFHFPVPSDEIPLSTVGRFVLLSGYTAPNVLHQVYGNARKRINPYLPGCIGRFSEFFQLDPHMVIMHSTLYPLLRFVQPESGSKIYQEMLVSTEAKVLARTAITHSRFHVFYGLNYCPACVLEDIESYGFSYWHTLHQVSGVQACYKHHCLLKSLPMGDGFADRVFLYPPMKVETVVEASDTQIRFATYAASLFELVKDHGINYADSYRRLLTEKGLTHGVNGKLKFAEIILGVANYWQSIVYANGGQPGVPESLKDFSFIGRILRQKTRSPCHPIKHLLFGCWLTDNNPLSLSMHSEMASLASHHEFCKTIESDDETEILSLLREGLSFNRIERITGKSRCCIKHIAEYYQIPHRSNSMRFSADIRRKVLIKALYGEHRKDIAQALGLTVGFVEQVIAAEPLLSNWRKYLRVRKNVYSAYLTLSALVKANREWGRTQLRKSAQAAYALLYNHDKELLNKVLPQAAKPRPYAKNWQSEDERIYRALNALDDISSDSLSSLDRKVDGHGNLLRNRSKLPKTSAILSRYHK